MGFLDDAKEQAEGLADKAKDIPGADKVQDLVQEKLGDVPGGDKIADMLDNVTGEGDAAQ